MGTVRDTPTRSKCARIIRSADSLLVMSISSPPNVSDNVRAEMARRRVTQDDLATHLGISRTAVTRRLSGEVDFRHQELVAIAGRLEVPLEQLLASAATEVPA